MLPYKTIFAAGAMLMAVTFSTFAQAQGPDLKVWDLVGDYKLAQGDSFCPKEIKIQLSCTYCDTDHPYRAWIYIPNFTLASRKHPDRVTTTGLKWEIEGYLNLGPITHEQFQFPGRRSTFSTDVTWDGVNLKSLRSISYHCRGILCSQPKETMETEQSSLRLENGRLHLTESQVSKSKRRLFGWNTLKDLSADCVFERTDAL